MKPLHRALDRVKAILILIRLVPVRGLVELLGYLVWEVPRVGSVFDEVLGPVLNDTITDGAFRREVRDSLLGSGLKAGAAMWAYAGAADVPFTPELVVLGGAFTRLYDDIIEDANRPGVDNRLNCMFDGEPFTPCSELEALMASVFRMIAVELARPPDDPIFAIVRRVHTYQLRSRQQREPGIDNEAIDDITRGKGGWGTVALCALLKPWMGPAEQDVIFTMGAAMQILDDKYDLIVDRELGVATTATRRIHGHSDVAAMVAGFRTQARRHFGAERDRRPTALLCAMAVRAMLMLARHGSQPAARRRSSRKGSRIRFLRRAFAIDTRHDRFR